MQPIRANILCRGLGQVEGNPVVNAVVTDNRAAGPGSLFVCIRGERADGHDYAAKAVQAGACAVVAPVSYTHLNNAIQTKRLAFCTVCRYNIHCSG